jgi:hypothetical protein
MVSGKKPLTLPYISEKADLHGLDRAGFLGELDVFEGRGPLSL